MGSGGAKKSKPITRLEVVKKSKAPVREPKRRDSRPPLATPPLPLRSRMRAVVHLGEVLEVEMGVDLGRPDVGMSQKFLDGAEVARGFQQVRGAGVPQQVGIDAFPDALGTRAPLECGADRARCKRSTAAAAQHRLVGIGRLRSAQSGQRG